MKKLVERENKLSLNDQTMVAANHKSCNCMSPLAISVEQAAKLLGIGRSTAYALKSRGEIPTFVFGGKTLVPVQALREIVARMSGTGMEAC